MLFKKTNLLALCQRTLITFFVLMTLTACQPEREVKPTPVKGPEHARACPPPAKPITKTITIEKPCECECHQAKVKKVEKPKPETIKLHQTTNFKQLKRSHWQSVNWLQKQNLVSAWPAWIQSCRVLVRDHRWEPVCQLAKSLNQQAAGDLTNQQLQQYFTNNFYLYQTFNDDHSSDGLVTGYYQPVLKGSRTRSDLYRYPLYHTPNDLITVSLADQYPALKHQRVRGKLVGGNSLTPYYSRGQIDRVPSPIEAAAFLYLNDPIDVFFLHVQGSGVIHLDSGEVIQVGYDNHNGHPYRSIGKALVDRGELTLSEASMTGIKRWAQQNPDRLQTILNVNPSYVFFKELPKGLPGPLGALGVPLYAEQTVAVDKRYIPLGAPVFISTTYPNSTLPLRKLVMAQDTGGAIKGGVRADFYWGAGDEAGKMAGAMKQMGKLWVLLPKTFPVE